MCSVEIKQGCMCRSKLQKSVLNIKVFISRQHAVCIHKVVAVRNLKLNFRKHGHGFWKLSLLFNNFLHVCRLRRTSIHVCFTLPSIPIFPTNLPLSPRKYLLSHVSSVMMAIYLPMHIKTSTVLLLNVLCPLMLTFQLESFLN